MSWENKNTRPEEFTEPEDYFEPAAYETPAMKRTQEQLTLRALELLGPGHKKILDVGCGTGYSTKILEKTGHEAKGIDIVPSMVKKAKEKGLDVTVSDMKDLPFEDNSFDAIISISALQWAKDVKAVAREFLRVLKPKGKAVIQFYPKNEEEAKQVARVFSQQGFSVNIAVDSPEIPKKRKVFLVLDAKAEP